MLLTRASVRRRLMDAQRNLRRVIAANRGYILRFLKDLVAINSFSRNCIGVDAVGARVADAMPRSFGHRTVKNKDLGLHHIFSHVRDDVPPIVLVGHLDTLCPEDREFDRLVEKGDRLVGPGVNDMKGGDVVLVWALRTLDACGLLEELSLVCLFNADEELGSPTSNCLFSRMAGAAFGLVFECGGPENTVVTTRKGIRRYRLHVSGHSAHFGNLKGRKISAIGELAAKIVAIESLNRDDGRVMANVGRVEGGLAANVVAERGSLDFEVRYWTKEVERAMLAKVRRLMSRPAVHGCGLRLEPLSYRPPLQPDRKCRRLFREIVSLGAELGQSIKEETRGGVSDANWLRYAGVPVVDGLGPLGDGDCTRGEYVITETVFQRIELTANLLLRLNSMLRRTSRKNNANVGGGSRVCRPLVRRRAMG
jgi:glutamate carboxypeptidase